MSGGAGDRRTRRGGGDADGSLGPICGADPAILSERWALELQACINDVREQAAICALDRGETQLRETVPQPCTCAHRMELPRVDFGPAGWRCGLCMRKMPTPGEEGGG